MGLESVLVIADEVDENLYLASRNLVNVLVVEPRYADPLSLVHYKKVLVTKGARSSSSRRCSHEPHQSALSTKFDEGRLAQVLVAPIVSEKATTVAEKHNQVLFKVLRDATKPEIKAAVELMFKVEVEAVSVVNIKGKIKRFGRSIGRRDNVKKAYVSLKAGQELNFSGRLRTWPSSRSNPLRPASRAVVKVVHAHLHRGAPEHRCSSRRCQNAGRNNNGHITIRHRGGGHKHHYRVVDFVRNKDGIPAKVERIEYDPNRTAHIALRVLRRWRAPLHHRPARSRSRRDRC